MGPRAVICHCDVLNALKKNPNSVIFLICASAVPPLSTPPIPIVIHWSSFLVVIVAFLVRPSVKLV